MRKRMKCRKALPTGTSRRSAKMRHLGLTKFSECDAQINSAVCTDKVCGNMQTQNEDLETNKDDLSTVLEIYFQDSTIKREVSKVVNEWKSVPEEEYCSRKQVARANRVGWDY